MHLVLDLDFWVHLVIDQSIKQTICVSYFTRFFCEQSVIDQYIKQTLCVRKCTELIRGTSGIGLVIKSDTLC